MRRAASHLVSDGHSTPSDIVVAMLAAGQATRTRLSRDQITGFWAAWMGWTLDGMDSFIYALVLAPALTELLPKSGIAATPGTVAQAGAVLFALFLVGWGLSSCWGPVADRFGRTRVLAATVFVYAAFTGIAAVAQSVWQLALFRLLAGIGIGGEWALAGTYLAEAWPEDRRAMGAGYLQTGYYAGFFLAAALNYTVGVHFGWRAMFLCGLAPVLLAWVITARVREPDRWQKARSVARRVQPFREIFDPEYRLRTLVNAGLLTVAIVGLWAAAVYEPTAIIALAKKAGLTQQESIRMASFGTGWLSLGTMVGCLALPPLAQRFGRRPVLAFYFLGMGVTIALGFGVLFYRPAALHPFLAMLFVLGFFGGNFTMFSLWLPEQYATRVRATAFAFATSIGRFVGAGVNFLLGWLVARTGTLGIPVACTAIAFVLGLALLPMSLETRGRPLPE